MTMKFRFRFEMYMLYAACMYIHLYRSCECIYLSLFEVTQREHIIVILFVICGRCQISDDDDDDDDKETKCCY